MESRVLQAGDSEISKARRASYLPPCLLASDCLCPACAYGKAREGKACMTACGIVHWFTTVLYLVLHAPPASVVCEEKARPGFAPAICRWEVRLLRIHHNINANAEMLILRVLTPARPAHQKSIATLMYLLTSFTYNASRRQCTLPIPSALINCLCKPTSPASWHPND